MQIPRNFVLCAAILFCPLISRADTDAQTRAREELRRKLAEIDAAAGNATPKSRPVTPKPAPAPAVAPSTPPMKSENPPAPATSTPGKTQIDSETRRKVEQELQQKMRELEGQTSQATPTAPSPKSEPATQDAREQLRLKMAEIEKQKPAPAAVPQPAPAPVVQASPAPVVAPTPRPVVATTDPEVEKAREALRRKIAEIEAQKPSPVVSAPTAPTPAPVTPTPQPVVVTAPSATLSATPNIPDTEAIAKAREEVRRKLAEMESQPVASRPVVAVPQPAPVAPTVVAAPGGPSFEPVPGISGSPNVTVYPPEKPKKMSEEEKRARSIALNQPPSAYNTVPLPAPSISATKAEKLAELLRKYKADEITPEQYHKERSAVLAEP